jgi:hypothetical protein
MNTALYYTTLNKKMQAFLKKICNNNRKNTANPAKKQVAAFKITLCRIQTIPILQNHAVTVCNFALDSGVALATNRAPAAALPPFPTGEGHSFRLGVSPSRLPRGGRQSCPLIRRMTTTPGGVGNPPYSSALPTPFFFFGAYKRSRSELLRLRDLFYSLILLLLLCFLLLFPQPLPVLLHPSCLRE